MRIEEKWKWSVHRVVSLGVIFHFLSCILMNSVTGCNGVDRTRRHCSVETIRGTGPSELGWSRPNSKNPLERAWPRWDQRRLSNRREQILHFDLSRKGREAITLSNNIMLSYSLCPHTIHIDVNRRATDVFNTNSLFTNDSSLVNHVSKEIVIEKSFKTFFQVKRPCEIYSWSL
mgnify:CR=1 FL=1